MPTQDADASCPSRFAVFRRVRRRWWLVVYLVLLAASHLTQAMLPGGVNVLTPDGDETPLVVPAATPQGPLPDRTIALGWRRWEGGGGTPVILIHGSPGQSWDFSNLGPELAASGRDVYAFDMPGFGRSTPRVPSHAYHAFAYNVLSAMDALNVPKAHLVGWSNGGGVVLHAADIAPERVVSVTLLAAIGDQAVEGSGDFYFEHFKYALGYGALVIGPNLIPHFGLFPSSLAYGFIRNFWDSDQRPLRGVMQRLETPALVLHGRHDFLVPADAAEWHHQLLRGSRLVMMDASHFMPFLSAEETAGHLRKFLEDVEAGRAVAGRLDLAPVRDRGGVTGIVDDGLRWFRWRHWWWQAAMVCGLVVLLPRVGVWGTAWLVAFSVLDIAVAGVGVWLARVVRPGKRVGVVRRVVAWPLIGVLAMIGLRLLALGTAMPEWYREVGAMGLVAALVVMGLAWWIIPRVWTWEGRQRMKAGIARVHRHEFWPAKVFYVPLIPWLVVQAIRRRGAMVFTCVNPGIEAGGGIVGESKFQILQAMRGPEVLPAVLVEAGDAAGVRAERAMEAIESRSELGGFPVILKPDSAQRGAGVRLARSRQDVADYFRRVEAAAVVQKYHPGPHEVGVFWIRDPEAKPGEPQGRIFAITVKEFSYLVGDGSRSIRKLILAHPRYRCQADVFFARFAGRLNEVLGEGARLRLAEAGNHAQGTLFRDGRHLITPALEAAIDRIASSFSGRDGGGFDFGRFDVRYPDEQALREGRDLGLVELNGTMSEATNLYDPDGSLFWSYGILFRQWERLYALGAWRRSQGGRPVGAWRLWRMVRRAKREQGDITLSD